MDRLTTHRAGDLHARNLIEALPELHLTIVPNGASPGTDTANLKCKLREFRD